MPDCPNCGAAVRDDGVREVVPCHYCGTDVPIPRRRSGITIDLGDGDVIRIDSGSPSTPRSFEQERRQALEAERQSLEAQLEGWKQLTPAAAYSYVPALFAGCGTFAVAVVIGVVIAAVRDMNGQAVLNGILFIAVFAAIMAGIAMASRQKRKATVEVMQQREEAIRAIQARLRAIDDELRTR